MGGGQSAEIQYSVPVTEKKNGESAVYRNPKSVPNLITVPDPSITTLKDVVLYSLKQNGDRPFLSTKRGEQRFSRTFKDTVDLARAAGSAILNENLAPLRKEWRDHQLNVFGVFCKNREEWVVLDIATVLYGLTLVPLYDTLGPDSISYVIGHSNLETVFCAGAPLDTLLNKTENLHNLKTLVALDEPITQQQAERAKSRGLRLIAWSELIDGGRKQVRDYANPRPQDCFTFSYTSGTTGNPKAAMLSHGNMVCEIAALLNTDLRFLPTDVHVSFLPLPHLFERLLEWNLIFAGSNICFYSGDVLKLKDDLIFWQPTFFAGVPRLYNRFYTLMRAGIEQLTGFKRTLAETAIETKLENLRTKAIYTHAVWDALIFNKMKAALGGRVRLLITGSAPIGTDVLEFMKIAMGCPFYEGYGQTESSAGTFLTSSLDPKSGHVGGPVVPAEFKVVDVPEMNYLSTNKNAEGQVTPQGEVCFRGPIVFLGYYRDEEKTREAVDADGWLHSGDVGTILPNGALKITDRVKNIFKLAQGEYIAPEKIEQIYIKTAGVDGAFLHGDSLQYYNVAVINPNKDFVAKIAKEKGIDGDYETLCKNIEIRKYYLQALTDSGKKAGLQGFEHAKNVYLYPKAFLEIGILTVTQKLQRHQARVYFKDQIAELYQEGELASANKPQ